MINTRLTNTTKKPRIALGGNLLQAMLVRGPLFRYLILERFLLIFLFNRHLLAWKLARQTTNNNKRTRSRENTYRCGLIQ
jgi:hypothetical protein